MYWKNKCIFSNILQKISSEKKNYEKMKSTTKRTIVLESFIIISSFDYDYTPMSMMV